MGPRHLIDHAQGVGPGTGGCTGRIPVVDAAADAPVCRSFGHRSGAWVRGGPVHHHLLLPPPTSSTSSFLLLLRLPSLLGALLSASAISHSLVPW